MSSARVDDEREYMTWQEAAQRRGGLKAVLITYDGRVWAADGCGYADRLDQVGLYEPTSEYVLQNIGGTHSVAILVYPDDLPKLAKLRAMGRSLFKSWGRS